MSVATYSTRSETVMHKISEFYDDMDNLDRMLSIIKGETIVSLGKQLSRRWYLGYERSVNATTGTWQLIYRIAQRFTLRAQSGSENALDMIWSWRW